MKKEQLFLVIFLYFITVSGFSQHSDSTVSEIVTNYDSWGVNRKTTSFESKNRKFLLMKDLKVNGVVRFVSHYRVMKTYYADMIGSEKNLSFIDYSNADAFSAGGNNRIQPLLDLRVEGRVTPNTIFRVGYSFSHSFLGLQKDSSRAFSLRQLFRFESITNTKLGTFKLTAGGGTTYMTLSPLTLSRRRYRDEAFEKVPWERYTNSPKKYNDYYIRESIRNDEEFNLAAVQGFLLEGENLPGNFATKIFYGKSNLNAYTTVDAQPFNLYSHRLYKEVSGHKIGVNLYHYAGETDKINGIKDRRSIVTADTRLNYEKIKITSELGFGRIENPGVGIGFGEAVMVKVKLLKALTKLPIDIGVYSIDKNVVSAESEVMNTNLKVPSGGVNRTLSSDGNLFINTLAEVDMMSNNRQGVILKTEEMIKKLKVEFAISANIEKLNLYDTITFMHRVNAFRRSRFTPSSTESGPYGRLRNRTRTNFEFIEITDSIRDYKKGFNMAELSLKYMLKLFNRDILFVNYSTVGSIREGASPLPGFGNKNNLFLTTFYDEFTTFYMISKKTVLVGFVGIELAKANNRTSLSTYNKKPLDQQGYGFGLGLDYDFMKNAGLHLRHRWMAHEDINFVLDKFNGQETTVELKYFF